MQVIQQSFVPKITLSHFDNGSYSIYETFYREANTNLQSYSWERSINNFSGSFSFSFKESVKAADNNLLMDKIDSLDLVHIYEHDKLVFIGVITDVSFSAQSGNIQKRVSVSGKSIEYLFEMLQISLDVSALSWAGKSSNEGNNLTFLTEISKKADKQTGKISVKSGVSYAFNEFKNALESYKEISNVKILDMIKSVYGSDNLEIFLECEDMDFKYPISGQLYQNKTIKFFDFVKNLLPEPVYEVYGKIASNDKPKICIREVPFDSDVWTNLECNRVKPEILTSYSFHKSCLEVYTTFISYIEGSILSPEFVKKVYGSTSGYNAQKVIKEKAAVFGFRPLEITFVGFDGGTTESEQKDKNDELNKTFEELNTRVGEWFGYMDEMYSGSIVCVNVDYETYAKTGERIQLGSNEFYVISEKHNWVYGTSPTVEYSVDRGGNYTNGKFSKCERISKFLEEFESV